MRSAASHRFLGVPVGAPPRMLLGLGDGEVTPESIAAGLERQRQRILRHPAGRDREAERLIRELEVAAEWLRGQIGAAAPTAAPATAATAPANPPPAAPTEAARTAVAAPVAPAAVRKALGIREPPKPPKPRTPPTPVPPRRPEPDRAASVELTEFDREVLNTLGSGGGWNSKTRPKLMTIADRYGVSRQGLMTVVRALGTALRSGRVRAELRPRAAVQAADMTLWRAESPSRVSEALERLDEAFAREVAGDTPARLVRLLLVFIGIGICAVFVLYRILSQPPPLVPGQQQAQQAAAPLTGEEIARRAAPPIAPAVEVDRPGVVRPAKWAKPPELHGAPPPDSVKAALRDALQAPERLAAIGRRLQLEASRPSAAIVRDWTAAQSALAVSWPSLDATTRAAAIEAGVAALRRIESDEVAKQFLDAWSVEYVRADEVLGVWSAAWSAGMLAEIAARPSSPAAVAAPAIDRLDPVVPRRALLRGKGTTVFDGAAGAWLDGAARTLVTSTSVDAGSADRWERWFDAQKSVRSGAPLQSAYLDAIGEVLESGLNITENGRGAELLGRLVNGVDWTERAPDQSRVRDAMTLWFTSTKIGASRLWVLTSLLDLSYDTAWFLPEFVVDPDATPAMRSKSMERILAAWPAPVGTTASGGIRVDSALLERWHAAFEKATNAPQSDDIARLRVAIAFARLNAVAQAFATDDVPAADGFLDETEQELASPPDLREATLTVGRQSGTDGEFSAAYEAAGRDATKRQDELRALRARPVTGDLGPRDAETLVSEALRGTPADVRELAQTVLAERFDSGPTVLQELLDQLPSAPQNSATLTLIEQVTRERLPEGRSHTWMRNARLALVQRLLALSSGQGHAVDALADRLTAAYAERGRLFRIGFEETVQIVPPDDWMARLVAQWRMKAGAMFLSEAFPASLDEIDRRHGVRMRLADGALQRCAAGQATLLELLAMVTVADRPSFREPIRTILDEAVARRARVGSVMEQIVEGERAVAQLMQLLFEPVSASPRSPQKPGQGGAQKPGAAPDESPAEPAPGIGAMEKKKRL